MGIDSLFIHRCSIERERKIGQGAYKQDVTTTTQLSPDQPCRLVVGSQRILSDDRTEFLTVTTYKLMLPAGTDIAERDSVTTVVLEDETTQGPFTVAAILPRRGRSLHHISVQLVEAKNVSIPSAN